MTLLVAVERRKVPRKVRCDHSAGNNRDAFPTRDALPPLSLPPTFMAPIPQTLDDETKELIDGLRRRERDIAEYQVPRLRDCTGPLSAQQRLSVELREDLDVFGKQIEDLEIHAEDVARKSDRLAILQLAEDFRDSNTRIRKDMRAALLHSKKTIDAQAKSNREELFGAVTPDSRNVEEKATDDALMKTSNDLTEALRRTLGVMQGELERSVLSHQMLEQSTSALRATSTQHDVLTSATLASKQLITALEQADWLDRLLVLAALAFFVLIVLFILKQRVLDRGIRLAFWWTRFIPGPAKGLEKAGDKLRLAVLEEGRVTASVSSVAQRVTQSAKDALSTALTQASSVVSDTADEISSTVSDSSSTLSTTMTSISSSASHSILDSISSSPTTSAEPISPTTLDALSDTLSLVQHSEL